MAKSQDKGLKDPVEDRVSGEASLEEELKTLDPNSQSDMGDEFLSYDEVGAVRERRTSAPHPFDGYKLGRKVRVGDTSVTSTFIVMLKPTEEPPPDPSNKNQTVYVSKEPGGSGRPGEGVEKVITFPTSHTRVAMHRQGTHNETVVFDRDILLQNGQVYKCAVIKSHSIRAQICFKYDEKKNRVIPDPRYLLADTKQATLLFRMCEAIYYQRTKAERNARDFDDTQESTAADARG